ncbi:hypothetical protein AYI70_g2270 [Smittium culicis]|uniref:Uncharacterized protein n=1 Tax=Smittium culicis TaxID=133412 RepID=A0A1R1Y983_9FUNG|nr:hypothetical protein AYI70_g2270 [Smittium culicis]
MPLPGPTFCILAPIFTFGPAWLAGIFISAPCMAAFGMPICEMADGAPTPPAIPAFPDCGGAVSDIITRAKISY